VDLPHQRLTQRATDPAAPGLSLAERAAVLADLLPAQLNKGIFSVDEPGFSGLLVGPPGATLDASCLPEPMRRRAGLVDRQVPRPGRPAVAGECLADRDRGGRQVFCQSGRDLSRRRSRSRRLVFYRLLELAAATIPSATTTSSPGNDHARRCRAHR